jgi:hypothetical protein
VQFALMKNTQVGRGAVAGGKLHDVAGNELAGVELLMLAAAQDGYRGADGPGQGGQGAFGLRFLPVADGSVDQNDAENDAAVDPLT